MHLQAYYHTWFKALDIGDSVCSYKNKRLPTSFDWKLVSIKHGFCLQQHRSVHENAKETDEQGPWVVYISVTENQIKSSPILSRKWNGWQMGMLAKNVKTCLKIKKKIKKDSAFIQHLKTQNSLTLTFHLCSSTQVSPRTSCWAAPASLESTTHGVVMCICHMELTVSICIS